MASTLASAVEAFRASGVTPATTAAVLSATRSLLAVEQQRSSGNAAAAGDASADDSTKPTPSSSVAIASLVRALGEDLTSEDDARRAGSTQLLAEVCMEVRGSGERDRILFSQINRKLVF